MFEVNVETWVFLLHIEASTVDDVKQASLTLSRNWSLMDSRICPFGRSFGNSFACQRFCEDSRSWCQCGRNTSRIHTMAPHEWLDVLMMFLELRDSVRPALRSLPNLKISLIVCPSGINFRTVWRYLNKDPRFHFIGLCELFCTAVQLYPCKVRWGQGAILS